MSVIAKLYFDGGERTLLSYNFQANKSLGSNGRPTFLKEMVFNVSFYPEKGDEFFYRWVLNKSEEPQRVKIVLYDIVWKRVVEQHEIIYSTGVQFHSEFDHQLGTINQLKIPALTIITNEIYYTDIRFGVHYFGEIERQKKKQQTSEIVGYYFQDMNGQRISQDELEPEMEIYLCIETENASNQTLTINLNDPRIDYEYEGQMVENDVLKDISISGNTTRIKLKTVEPKN
ncbi:hypothetical protein [Capnocytophaga sputigena]|jgi:hypothetical protein|uniref:hypothetical protein n=1 Tax=Capnocytophaga sputigena TaxID=1019 RepID=UPI0031F4C797